jgi:hypothetical protein
MYSNAYQNGPCFEVWDAKGTSSETQWIQQKMLSISSLAKQSLIKTQDHLTKMLRATFTRCKVKTHEWFFQPRIAKRFRYISDSLFCTFSFPLGFSGGLRWVWAI